MRKCYHLCWFITHYFRYYSTMRTKFINKNNIFQKDGTLLIVYISTSNKIKEKKINRENSFFMLMLLLTSKANSERAITF